MRFWPGAVVLAGLAFVGCGQEAPPQPSPDPQETRAIMQRIYAAIRVALPASADPEELARPERAAEIGAALDALADNASLLQSHVGGEERQMQFLARSVARDARDVRRAWREGQHPRAAFLLRQITEDCVVCHTRLPSDDSPVAKRFFEAGELEQLPEEPRASLQIATRRFDEALVTLESLLATSEHPALLIGPLTDYLVVSIRVKQDFERPVATLRRFSERADLWPELRSDVATWLAALPGLAERARGTPALETGRELFEDGLALGAEPEAKRGLVHFVTASSVLQLFLRTEPPPEALGETYYLLGMIEARIGRNYWVTPAPFFLEESIRLAPKQPYAADAFARLEAELRAAYEGADQEVLPPEEAERLQELRGLVQGE
jgi:hypothetical protein